MSGFKSYKIRDGVHIPSEKYKENWNAIFGKKPKKPKKDTMTKNIEWACDYVDDDGIRYDTWYCNSCDTDIDDKIQEMEMHECKKPTKGLDCELETKIQDNSVPAKNKNTKTV